MQLAIDGTTYLDDRDLTPTDFYRMLDRLGRPPATSAPSPASFLEAFREAARDASAVVCVTVSPRFSSSYDSARTAAKELRDTVPDLPVAVIDSQSAAGGQGLIAVEACRAAERGDPLDAVVEATRAVIPRVSLVAYLDTLYYVWKSGRVPRLAYAGTSLLKLKPIFELSAGEVRNVARPRTGRRAGRRLVELMSERVDGPVHATVMHADAPDAAEELRERVASEFECEELFVSEFSPVMGAHTGPGLLGIAFWSEGL